MVALGVVLIAALVRMFGKLPGKKKENPQISL
jgi:hypothetical protein